MANRDFSTAQPFLKNPYKPGPLGEHHGMIFETHCAYEKNRENDMDGKKYFRKGQKAFVTGDYEKSAVLFSKALETGHDKIITLLSRGAAFLSTREYVKALQDFATVLDIDGKNERAYFYRGVIRLKIGEEQRAIRDLNTALTLNPNRGAALFARGVAFTRLDQEDEAAADFKQALECADEETEMFLNIFGRDKDGFLRFNTCYYKAG